jgi:hypothetical protein
MLLAFILMNHGQHMQSHTSTWTLKMCISELNESTPFWCTVMKEMLVSPLALWCIAGRNMTCGVSRNVLSDTMVTPRPIVWDLETLFIPCVGRQTTQTLSLSKAVWGFKQLADTCSLTAWLWDRLTHEPIVSIVLEVHYYSFIQNTTVTSYFELPSLFFRGTTHSNPIGWMGKLRTKVNWEATSSVMALYSLWKNHVNQLLDQPGLRGRLNIVIKNPGHSYDILRLVWYVLICGYPSFILYDMLRVTICMICYKLQFVVAN